MGINFYKDNNLTFLPASIERLRNLQSLVISDNRLSSLPKEVGRLRELTYLNLSHNELSTIPREIGYLTKLTDLRLSNNKLSTIPKEIGHLTNLRVLDLSTNNLTKLPSELKNLSNLQSLCLHDNPFTVVPNILKKKRVIILRSKADIGNCSHMTLSAVRYISLKTYEFYNCYANTAESIHSEDYSLSLEDMLFKNISQAILKYIPEVLILHTGESFNDNPETFIKVLIKIKKNNPSLRYGIEKRGYRSQEASKLLKDKETMDLFDTSSEMINIENFYSGKFRELEKE